MHLERLTICVIAICAGTGAASSQTTSWALPSTGTWTVAGNWTSGVPDAGTQAIIDAVGAAYSVNLTGSQTASGLLLNSSGATLNHSAGTLDLGGGTFGLQGGTYLLGAATLRNAVFDAGAGALQLGNVSGGVVLDNVSVQSGELYVRQGMRTNTNVTLQTALTGTGGSMRLSTGVAMRSESPVTVSNLAILADHEGEGSPVQFGAMTGAMLTLDADSSFQARVAAISNILNHGTVRTNGASPSQDGGLYFFETFTNSGLAVAENGGRIRFDSTALNNQGIISAENGGRIRLHNLTPSSVLGNVSLTDATLEIQDISTSMYETMILSRSNSEVLLQGTWNNNSDTMALNSSTGNIKLEGGAIIGGSLAFADGAALEIGSGNNLLDNVQITSGRVQSGVSGRLDLGSGWQQEILDLNVDGVRLAMTGDLSLSDLSRFTFSNGSRVEIAGDLDLAGQTLSPASLGRDVGMGGGEVWNGTLDFTESPLVFTGKEGQLITSTVRDSVVLGEVIVESGQAIFTGTTEIDGVSFRNRSITQGLQLQSMDIDLTGKGFTVAEGVLSITSGSEFTNGTITIAPEGTLGVGATLIGTHIHAEPGSVIQGSGLSQNVTLSGSPFLRGIRISGILHAMDLATLDAAYGSLIQVPGQASLVGDFVGINSNGSSSDSEIRIFSNGELTIPDGSSLSGRDLTIFDNGSNGTLDVQGLFQASGSSALSKIDISTINISGTVEAIDGSELFLGSPLSELNVTGGVTARDGGSVYVSGVFAPGAIHGAYTAPSGTMAFAGEILNAGHTIHIDSNFEKFGLGHREQAQVFGGEIQVEPGSSLHILGLTQLYDVAVTGDVIAERVFALETGSTLDGSLTMRNGTLALVNDANPGVPDETFSVRFEETRPAPSQVAYIGQDRDVRIGAGLSVTGAGGNLITYGTASSLAIDGALSVEPGMFPIELQSASVSLNGATTIAGQSTLKVRDALDAESDGNDASVFVGGILRMDDAASFDITGDLHLAPTSRTVLGLTDLPADALITATDEVELGGAFILDTDLATSIMPGDSFVLIEAGSVTGMFDRIGFVRFTPFSPLVTVQGGNVIVTLFSNDFPIVGEHYSGETFEAEDPGPIPAPATVGVALLLCPIAARRRR